MGRSLTWLRIDPRTTVPVVVPSDANRQVLSGGRIVLADLAQDEGDVSLEHDVDWDVFPEIAQALRCEGFEEVSFCVAFSMSHDKFGVGVAGKGKLREQAARVALAVALATDVEDFGQLAERHADFASFCSGAGMSTGALRGSRRPGSRLDSSPVPRSKRRRLHEEEVREDRRDRQPAVEEAGALGEPLGEVLPRDEPIWISIPMDVNCPDQLTGLDSIGLVLSHDGQGGGVYNKQADRILGMFASPDEIQAYDDPSWNVFPAIGEELRKRASRDECLHVLVCPGREAWAAGVAMRSRNRIVAAKVALAVSLALQQSDADVDLQMPEFEGLVRRARLALDDTALDDAP